MDATVLKPYRSGRQRVTFDRLAVEGGKVKIFRQNNSVHELRRGIKQVATLYGLGARFEEILIQIR